jgi:uracil-DNA glycosylase family 4
MILSGIIDCKKCPRLRTWARSQRGRRKRYEKDDYWAKPVPGFGDPYARLLVVGLAPGAHGANRTGRPFTGDVAGEWLYSALFRAGFSSKKTSENRFDDLTLKDVYITNAVKCAPPQDRPLQAEFMSCAHHLWREIQTLPNIKVILVFGQKAFIQIVLIVKEMGIDTKPLSFTHGAVYSFGERFPTIKVSYHTSKRNFIRKIMSEEKLNKVFDDVKMLIQQQNHTATQKLSNRV